MVHIYRALEIFGWILVVGLLVGTFIGTYSPDVTSWASLILLIIVTFCLTAWNRARESGKL